MAHDWGSGGGGLERGAKLARPVEARAQGKSSSETILPWSTARGIESSASRMAAELRAGGPGGGGPRP